MTLFCPGCFGDQGLRNRLIEIRPIVGRGKCDFHPTKKGIPAEDVAEIVENVFRQHYGLGDYQAWTGEQAGESLEICISEFTSAEEGAGIALTEAILAAENQFDPDFFYEPDQNYVRLENSIGSYAHSALWLDFCDTIMYDVRFFNEEAERILKEIFDGIQYQKDHNFNPPVRKLKHEDNSNAFWRARKANSISKRKNISDMPALELGAPPMRLRKAGRMNSSGIRAFYGALDLNTSISEIRPIVGDKVIAAQFNLARDLYVLDTTRFSAPIKEASVFNKSYEQRVSQWEFMQEFMKQIAKPISPGDTHLDYIPTQAVAEYLVQKHKFKRDGNNVSIEGLIFNSAQRSGSKNIVLFGDAAHAVLTDEETAIDKERNKEAQFNVWYEYWSNSSQKPLSPALKVDLNSVCIKEVKSAKFSTDDHIDYDENLDF